MIKIKKWKKWKGLVKMKYNEEVAYDLGLSLEDLYVLQKIEDKIKDTNLSTYGDKGEFTFNQVDLFKICKFVFKI